MVDNLTLKTVIGVINDGVLLLDGGRRFFRFKLCNKKCSISGLLIQRPDWSDKCGRPGLMPLIQRLELTAHDACMTTSLDVDEEHLVSVYDALANRLDPMNLFLFSKKGWELRSQTSARS